eukprot:CAMPEP_0175412916 /NCGR_PEP_ID=MMETSP0095-20121207/42887_1 /TAXON_ID=311494 /ORGANISM="Alexandrium monilatum, Strain CCMP3105" /LENGTH=288 /DNA_ID=CAMNT_0016711945 /DNA_START=166 /DNA_END=1029 /DNA_ORIENTATION=-
MVVGPLPPVLFDVLPDRGQPSGVVRQHVPLCELLLPLILQIQSPATLRILRHRPALGLALLGCEVLKLGPCTLSLGLGQGEVLKDPRALPLLPLQQSLCAWTLVLRAVLGGPQQPQQPLAVLRLLLQRRAVRAHAVTAALLVGAVQDEVGFPHVCPEMLRRFTSMPSRPQRWQVAKSLTGPGASGPVLDSCGVGGRGAAGGPTRLGIVAACSAAGRLDGTNIGHALGIPGGGGGGGTGSTPGGGTTVGGGGTGAGGEGGGGDGAGLAAEADCCSGAAAPEVAAAAAAG